MYVLLWAIFVRDIRLALRTGGYFWTNVLFFVLLFILLPFAIGPNLSTLAQISPAFLWIVVVLSTLMAIDRLFMNDSHDGSLSLMQASPLPDTLLVLTKGIAYWVTTSLPVILLAPFLSLLMGFSPSYIPTLSLILCAGTPALTCVGLLSATLTMRYHQSPLLGTLVALPLMIPTVIFGVAATYDLTQNHTDFFDSEGFLFLLAFSGIMLIVGVIFGAIAIRSRE